MTVWRLIPVDLQARAWTASIYKGSVLVRAASEQEARALVCRDFSGSSLAAATLIAPPWIQPGVVRAEVIVDPHYPVTGRPEILELS